MCTSVKTQLIAFSVMSSVGVAMPVAAFIASEPFAVPYHAFGRLAPEVDQQALVEAAEPVDRSPVVSLVATPVAPGLRWSGHALQPLLAAEQGSAVCYQHSSQTLATGEVRVCDVARTSNHQPHRLFDAIDKPPVLGLHRIDSPSGLLR